MAELVLKNVGIWMNGQSYAGVSNQVGIELSADAPESTTFAGEWRTIAEGGLKSAAFSMEGYYDAEDADGLLFDSLAEARSAMVVPAGMDAGDLAYVVPMSATAYTIPGSIGELLGFTFAGEGDGATKRAQVFDIRDNQTVDNVTARVNLGPILTGETMEVWVHIARRAGRVQLELESAVDGTTATATTRDVEAGINSTRLHKFSVAGPITDEWWQLRYDFNVGSPDFDFASAVLVS